MLKRLVPFVLGMTLAVSSVQALTKAELEFADDTLRKMDSLISKMRGSVQGAARGRFNERPDLLGLEMNPAQKKILTDSYENEKAELQTLLLMLP